MTVDQHELSDLAEDLRQLYVELDRAKYERQQASRDERKMRPTPGPTAPAAGWAISLDAQLSAELKEMVRDAINYTDQSAILVSTNGPALCRVVRSNAMEISENFPAVDDLAELMRDQTRTLTHKLAPRLKIDRPRLEKYQPAAAILQRLHRLGHPMTKDALRMLTTRSQTAHARNKDIPIITTETRGGRTTYRLTEVLAYITRNHPPEETPS